MRRTEYHQVADVEEIIPSQMDPDTIYIISAGGHPYSVAFLCPCGGDDLVHVPVNREKQPPPSWTLTRNDDATVTLAPSLLRMDGCRSHFFIRENRVDWC